MPSRKKTRGAFPLRSPDLNPEDRVALTALVDRYRSLSPEALVREIPSFAVAHALVEGLPVDDPATPPLLVLLQRAYDQRPIRKAIRKTVFKMKQKGVPVPTELERDPGDPILKRPAEELDPIGLLGPIDSVGNRGALVALPRTALGYDAGFGVVGDTEGFVFFRSGTYGRKQIRDLQTAFLDGFGRDWVVRASAFHVAAILEKAYGLMQESAVPPPQEYLRLRPILLDRALPLRIPAIYQSISPSEIQEDHLGPGRIERLMGHSLLDSWVIAPKKIQQVVDEIKAVEDSPLLLSEYQRQGRIEEIKDKWIRGSYTPFDRSVMKSRLEETAYILLQRKEEEHARFCIAISRSLDLPESPIAVNPFLKALLNRTLDRYLNTGKIPDGGDASEGKTSSSLPLP